MYLRLFSLFFLLGCTALLILSWQGKSNEQFGKIFPSIAAMPSLSDMPPTEPPYVVNLFASWCTPCIAELPYLKQVKSQIDVPIIGVAWRDKPDALKDWIEKHDAAFDNVLLDERGLLGGELGISGIPVTFIVDAQGTIVHRHDGPLTEKDVASFVKLALQTR